MTTGRRRILIVEDDGDACEYLRYLCQSWGFEVVTAARGTDAVDLAVATRPDVAIVDIGLPDIDGYEVARQIRLDARCDGIGLVALTGYDAAADIHQAREAGFDVHIAKPVQPTLLRGLLDEFRAPDEP